MRRQRIKLLIGWLILLGAFTVDRATKLFFLKTGQEIKIIDQLLWFRLQQNEGLVFGWGSVNWLALLLIFGLLFLIVRLGWQSYQRQDWFSGLVIGFIFSGAISNLIDRLFYQAVIDWIEIPWWSVFNLADIYIVGAAVIWFFSLLYDSKRKKIPTSN